MIVQKPCTGHGIALEFAQKANRDSAGLNEQTATKQVDTHPMWRCLTLIKTGGDMTAHPAHSEPISHLASLTSGHDIPMLCSDLLPGLSTNTRTGGATKSESD